MENGLLSGQEYWLKFSIICEDLDVMIWSEWFDQKNIEQDLKR